MSTRFDRDYYRRFYYDSRTAVTSRAEMRARARLIGAYADHIGLPVRRMLDAGCGIGLLRAPLLRAFPKARYTGLEYSEYLCRRYGWTQGSLADFTADPFDLVVCYDVMQYLDDRTAARAIVNRRSERRLMYWRISGSTAAPSRVIALSARRQTALATCRAAPGDEPPARMKRRSGEPSFGLALQAKRRDVPPDAESDLTAR